ncbi:MAG: sulfatase [Pseudoxanthomonas sp.]
MGVNRRTFISAGMGATLAVGSGTRAQAGAALRRQGGRRRNVLLVIGDDHGLDLSCLGVGVDTPALDALARQGVLFTDAYASVSSCSSSRSTLYTGLYSHTNGMYGLSHDVHNFSLLPNVRTLPWMLGQAGYATAIVGKLHVKPEELLAWGDWLLPERPGDRDVAAMARAAGGWMRAQGGRPFFLTIGYSDPHRSGDPTAFGNDRSWPGVVPRVYAPEDVTVPAHLPDLPGVRRDLAQYYQAVSRMDAGIGLLLSELESCGAADDTLVIYLSDNGRPFPAAKDNLYGDGIHLPLIVRAPGMPGGGGRNAAMVSWIDITPTILDWTGVEPPADYAYLPLPGRSLLPVLGDPQPQGWDEVFATHSFHEINQYYPVRSLRNRRYSYFRNLEPALEVAVASDVAMSASWQAIASTPGARLGGRSIEAFLHRPAEELYDLHVDPGEVTSLAGDPGHADVLGALRMRLEHWRTATRDPWQSGTTSPFGNHI